MSVQVKSRIDRSMVHELGSLELGDLARARASVEVTGLGPRLERPIVQIRLEQIGGESRFQSRVTTFDVEEHPEDAELLASVREHGVLEPIMVVRDGDSGGTGVYNLVFGHRRRAAAAMAGCETIPAIVARGSDDLALLTLAENSGSRRLSPFERAVALVRLKKDRPELTQTELAKRLGMSQGAVSNLLAAYEGSPAALRGLFAEGMAPRAVVELQGTFERLDEKEQVKFSERLRRASRETVRGVNELVRAGVKPQAAVAAVGRSRAERTGEEGHTPVAAEELQALAEQTGAGLQTVKALAGKAKKAGAGLEALRLACAYVARGGTDRDPVGIASELARDRQVTRLVARKLELDRKALACLKTLTDERQKAFFKAIVSGGSDGA